MALPSPQKSIRSNALRIACFYLVLGLAWVLAGDWLQQTFFANAGLEAFTGFQTLKGSLFVVLTAVLLFGLIFVTTKRTYESERTYRELFLANPHPMFIYEPIGLKILNANQSACDFFNYDLASLTRHTLYDLHPKTDHDRLQKVTAEPRPAFFKSGLWEMVKKDGTPVIVSIQSFETQIKGKVSRLVAAYDLTETIRAQKSLEDINASLRFANDRLQRQDMELRNLYQRFDLARQSAGIGIWEWWPDKQLFLWDPFLSQMLEDALGAGYHSLSDLTNKMNPADAALFQQKLLETNPENKLELEFQLHTSSRPGGKWIHLSGKYLNKSHTTDPMERIIGVAWDISELKHQELALIEAKRNQDALINNTEDLIWSVDTRMRLVSFNNPYQQYMSAVLNRVMCEGDNVIFDNLSRDKLHNWQEHYTRALQGDTFHVHQESINPFSGAIIRTETKFYPILDEEQEIVGVSCFSRDITQLEETSRKLFTQNKALGDIAWIAVHELRGPLTRAMTVTDSLNIESVEDEYQLKIISSLGITLNQLDELVTRMAIMAEDARLKDRSIASSPIWKDEPRSRLQG